MSSENKLKELFLHDKPKKNGFVKLKSAKEYVVLSLPIAVMLVAEQDT